MVCASAMSLTAQKNLKTEHLVSPLGIDNNAPRLSWQTLGESQKSYALVVDTDSVAQLREGEARGARALWRLTNRMWYMQENL